MSEIPRIFLEIRSLGVVPLRSASSLHVVSLPLRSSVVGSNSLQQLGGRVGCNDNDDGGSMSLWGSLCAGITTNPFSCVCPSAGAHYSLKLMWPSNAENTLECLNSSPAFLLWPTASPVFSLAFTPSLARSAMPLSPLFPLPSSRAPGCLWWLSLCCEPPIHTLAY